LTLQKDLDTLQKWEQDWKMEFHPEKCQLLRITNKRKPIQLKYNIHGVTLQETSAAKYLGVVIDSRLRFKEQYSELIKKSNKVLSFLRRNVGDCPSNIKAKCYQTLVQPILEYGCAIWDPHHLTDINRIEKVHKRGARFVTGNYKFESGNTNLNMQKLNWKPLEERRAAIKLNLFFKGRTGGIDIPFNHLSLGPSQNRRPGTYAIPTSNIDSHLYSFYPSTIRLWNSLPAEIKLSKNADAFKANLHKITLRSAYSSQH